MSDKRNVWLDGIMGVAVGDALGLPVQFTGREELASDPVTEMLPCDLYFSPIGTWSDDTSMTMAISQDDIGCGQKTMIHQCQRLLQIE